MRAWLKHGVRGVIVLAGVIALTSFSIDATDTFRDSNTLLSQLASQRDSNGCSAGTVEITAGETQFCIDVFENSFAENCPYPEPRSIEEAKVNADSRGCQSVSAEKKNVASFVTYQFAETMCAKRGARLPTASEWHEAAIGTPDTAECNTNGTRSRSGAFSSCVSLYGVHDMIGNVWEWVAGAVQDGVYESTTLAKEGYVNAVDTRGLPTESASEPNTQFNNDYVWSAPSGSFALMRGGFYGSEEDAGLYSVHAKVSPSYGSEATGFRCVVVQ